MTSDTVLQEAIKTANALTPDAVDRVTNYYKMLANKANIVVQAGFTPDQATYHPSLHTEGHKHQTDAITWAAQRGRGLIAANFGIGKTRMQIELLKQVHASTGKPVLIVCPLPLDIVHRLIERFSQPGEIVFDPFGGLFTVPYQAIQMGRFGYGCELNPDYYELGVKYCQDAEVDRDTPTLFDLIDFAANEPAESADVEAV